MNGPWPHNTRMHALDLPVEEQPLGQYVRKQLAQRLQTAYGDVTKAPVPELFDRLITIIGERIQKPGGR